MDQVISFLTANKDVLVTFIVALIAVIKLTAWGKAQSTALDAIVGVIESLGATDVKKAVAANQQKLSSAASDAITESVAKADVKKTTTSTVLKVVKEIFRGL